MIFSEWTLIKAGRGEWIRTTDLLRPMQVRYQTAPRPDKLQTRITSITAKSRLDRVKFLRLIRFSLQLAYL